MVEKNANNIKNKLRAPSLKISFFHNDYNHISVIQPHNIIEFWICIVRFPPQNTENNTLNMTWICGSQAFDKLGNVISCVSNHVEMISVKERHTYVIIYTFRA